MFWFTAFMFSDLCTHRPLPGFAVWQSPARMHKTNFNITCSQHINMPLLEDVLALSFILPSKIQGIIIISSSILYFVLCFKIALKNILMKLLSFDTVQKYCCAIIDNNFKLLIMFHCSKRTDKHCKLLLLSQSSALTQWLVEWL